MLINEWTIPGGIPSPASNLLKNRRVSARQPTCFSLMRKEKQAKETLWISGA
jgi:hypothetical protein